VQDAVIRALDTGARFASPEHLRRWLTTVAWRRAVDVHRQRSPVAADGDVLQLPSTDRTDEVVEHRDAVRAVLGAIGELTEDQREALLGVEVPSGRRAAVRVNVRRHRARRLLLAMVDGFVGLVVWLRARRTAVRSAPVLSVSAASLFLVASLVTRIPDSHSSVSVAGSRVVAVGAATVASTAAVRVPSPMSAAAAVPAGPEAGPRASPHPVAGAVVASVAVETPTGRPATAAVREGRGEPELCLRGLGQSYCLDVQADSTVAGTSPLPGPPGAPGPPAGAPGP
jgi:hypothetical protein